MALTKQTIEAVNNVLLEDLADRLGYTFIKKAGRQNLWVCPKCGQHNAYIHPTKNIFKCFGGKLSSCDWRGTRAIDMYGFHDNIDYDPKGDNRKKFPAYVEGVCKVMGIPIEYTNGKSYKPKGQAYKPRHEIQQEEPAAPDHLCDYVYRHFLGMLTRLQPQHVKEWRESRKYRDEEIKMLGLRSVPNPEELPTILDKLVKKLKEEQLTLNRIPGFYQRFIPYKPENFPESLLEWDEQLKGFWIWTITASNGYFIPVRNQLGQIIRLRVRRDNGSPKYIWFSSYDNSLTKTKKTKLRKGGASSGAPINVVPPVNQIRIWSPGTDLSDCYDVSTVIATEGEHKSIISANLLEQVVVGVPGVGNYKGVLPLLEKWGTTKLILAYDMDFLASESGTGNKNVMQHLQDFAVEAKKIGVDTFLWAWNKKHAKGLDDLLLQGMLPKYERNVMNPQQKIPIPLSILKRRVS